MELNMAVPRSVVVKLSFIIQQPSDPAQFYLRPPEEITLPAQEKEKSEYLVKEYIASVIFECEKRLEPFKENAKQKENHDKVREVVDYYHKAMAEFTQTQKTALKQIHNENFQKNPQLFIDFIQKKSFIKALDVKYEEKVKTQDQIDMEKKKEEEEWLLVQRIPDDPPAPKPVGNVGSPPSPSVLLSSASLSNASVPLSTDAVPAEALSTEAAAAAASGSASAAASASGSAVAAQEFLFTTTVLSASGTPAQQLPFGAHPSHANLAFGDIKSVAEEVRNPRTSLSESVLSPVFNPEKLSFKNSTLQVHYFLPKARLKVCLYFGDKNEAATFLNIMLIKKFSNPKTILMLKRCLGNGSPTEFLVIANENDFVKFKTEYATLKNLTIIDTKKEYPLPYGECEQIYPPFKMRDLSQKIGLDRKTATSIIDSLDTQVIHDSKLCFQAHWTAPEGGRVDTKAIKELLSTELKPRNKAISISKSIHPATENAIKSEGVSKNVSLNSISLEKVPDKKDPDKKHNIEITLSAQFSPNYLSDDFSTNTLQPPLTFCFLNGKSPKKPLCFLKISKTGATIPNSANAAPPPTPM